MILAPSFQVQHKEVENRLETKKKRGGKRERKKGKKWEKGRIEKKGEEEEE